MLSLPIGSLIEPRRLVVAAPDTTVSVAAALMLEGKVGAVLVVEDGRLAGIFTERDAVYRVMAAGRDPLTTLLKDVMTPDPLTVAPEETFGYALLLMHEKGFRHAPVVVDGRPIGVVSARHALDPDLEEFAAEAERRKHIRRRA
ncbi:MAG: putative signal-transduction protein with domain [Burkholderiales bacterium]|jgi:CBS domain-containing protein|nr:putative signal-transduction protein with domain [Burkholderiales bacterium]